MAILPVRCPSGEGTAVVKWGKTERGQQRYLCQTAACSSHTFLVDYTNRGYMPAVKRQIIDLAMNRSGIRDTARVLGNSTDTVIRELKRKKASSRR
jgi:transposase-like protein